uniref:Uncharacterized protein n=1 Tax=Siphoviridae sp. ctbLB3 TaxID=2825565 RepID=A0A8S5PNC9_9CAUD|nr:MAG TPA: hypothetical protein [Siphoviridae sp. ctbLB3]
MEMSNGYALYELLHWCVYFELGCERLNRDCNVGDAPWLNAGGVVAKIGTLSLLTARPTFLKR